MFIIVSALTLAGILILGFMVMRYYWGERGTPPPKAAERRRLREAFRLGTRVCLMDKGKIVLLDTPENFAKSDLPLVRSYLETVNL